MVVNRVAVLLYRSALFNCMFVCTAASGGRHHTAVITKDGDSYTFGCNTQVSIHSVMHSTTLNVQWRVKWPVAAHLVPFWHNTSLAILTRTCWQM